MEIFAFGAGKVEMADDGAVAAVLHPVREQSLLLGAEPIHDTLHHWGKGFVLTDGGGHRFDAPVSLRWRSSGIDLLYRLGPLELRVGRRFGEYWTETYELRNAGTEEVRVGSIGISTPWRDVYTSSRESLGAAVHAHVWTGGADAWVWAVPMDGSGPGLGLQVMEGELWSYSVESREPATSSNLRGHLYLHVTDWSRAPHAFGGQPEITLDPARSHRWTWQLGWYDTLAAFHETRRPLVEVDRLVAGAGETIHLTLAEGVEGPTELTSSDHGITYATVTASGGAGASGADGVAVGDIGGAPVGDVAVGGGRRAGVAVLFHAPVRELVEARVRYILDRQRRPELTDSRRFAFVPYDTESGLTVLSAGWRDWSDARERIGMALLLQEARDRGWGDRAELVEALAGYQEFVEEHLLAPDGTVADDSVHETKVRLYNFPWFARFLLGQGDVPGAARVLDRYYELGGAHFLAFDLGPLLTELAERLPEPAASRMRAHLLDHARTFLEYGDDLPPHEVNYEQSMVAPLVELLLAAYRLEPDVVPAEELKRRLRWLTAFAADQPDARVQHVPIRHWDGYWFGLRQQWGDVFPHYWSVLSASVYLTWPEELGDAAKLRAIGEAILRANLVNFAPDGSATCAFVYPSCVNGRPAHRADPLANDQDWALVYLLRHTADR